MTNVKTQNLQKITFRMEDTHFVNYVTIINSGIGSFDQITKRKFSKFFFFLITAKFT